jgi:hypothetical protein
MKICVRQGAFMKKGNFFAAIRKFCVLASICALFFAAGYGMGVKKSVEALVFDVNEKAVASKKSDGGYSAILSGEWIYIYDDMGALYKTVYVYTDYMTEKDKAELSNGIDFANEAEMHAFITVFE